MPKVPIYESKITPAATGVVPTVPPQTAGLVGESLASAGMDLSRIGFALDAAKKQVELQKSLTAAHGEFLDYETESLADPNWETAPDRAEKKFQEIRDTHVSQLTDPKSQEKFGLQFDQAAAFMRNRIKRDAHGKMIDAGRAVFLDALNQDEREYFHSQTDPEREIVLERTKSRIRENVNLGFLSAQEGVRTAETWLNQVNKTRLASMVEVNPRQALAELTTPGRHDYLDPETKVQLTTHARALVEREDNDLKSAAVYQELATTFKGNPQKAMDRISDPAYQKEKGLSLGQVREVYNFFAVEQAKREHAVAQAREDGKRREVNAYVAAMMAGDRSRAAAIVHGAKFMDPGTQLAAWESLKKSAWETDPAVEADVTLKIIRGQITTDEQLAGYLGHGLGPNEFESKRKLLQGEQQAKGKLNQFDLAVKWFEGQTPDKDEQAKNRPLFINTLNALVQQQGLKSYDPKVFELGMKLMEAEGGGQTKRSLIFDTWWPDKISLLEKIAEEKPWLTGKEIDTTSFQGILNAPGQGRPAAAPAQLTVPIADPDLPGASAQEIQAVYQALQGSGYAVTPANKQAVLKKIRARK